MYKRLKLDDGYYYLASPYSKYPYGRQTAFHHICTVGGKLLSNGVNIYCPIAHTHPLAEFGGLDPLDHELYLNLDKQLFKGAHGMIVAMMPTWRESYGIQYEISEFEAVGKPIYWLEWPSCDLVDKKD